MSDLKIQFDEVTEPKLNVIDAGSSGLNIAGGKPTVNFGPGADLLMNPSAMKKANSPKTDIALGDLTQLNSMDINSGRSSMKEARKSLFSSAGISVPKVSIMNDLAQWLDMNLSNLFNKEPIKNSSASKELPHA